MHRFIFTTAMLYVWTLVVLGFFTTVPWPLMASAVVISMIGFTLETRTYLRDRKDRREAASQSAESVAEGTGEDPAGSAW